MALGAAAFGLIEGVFYALSAVGTLILVSVSDFYAILGESGVLPVSRSPGGDGGGAYVAVEAAAEDGGADPVGAPRGGGGNRVRHLAAYSLVVLAVMVIRDELSRPAEGPCGWGLMTLCRGSLG